MPSSLESFDQIAQNLARNPLGIIALFIVLIYGFACLVVGLNSGLQPEQKTPLIWFLVVFPVLVLGVFGWLVSRHHTKLYSPSDFKSEETFLKTLSPEQQRQKLISEINTTEVEYTNLINSGTDKLSIETKSISRNRIMEDYLLAEDFALRELEIELGQTVLRHVEIAGVQFDGMVLKKDLVIGIEVKLILKPDINRKIVQTLTGSAMEAASKLKSEGRPQNFKLLIAFVTQFSDTDQTRFEERVKEKFFDVAVPMNFKFYSFNSLKEKYGIETRT